MPPRTTSGSAFLELELTPDPGFINNFRAFIEIFCAPRMAPERAGGVSIAAHELLQNAVDYSTDGWARLKLQIDTPHRRVSLQVESTGTPEKVQGLRELIKRIEEEPDALTLYLALMRETAKRREGSGLGLARIRFECGMDLRVEIDDGMVRVTASGPLDAPAPVFPHLRPEGASQGTGQG